MIVHVKFPDTHLCGLYIAYYRRHINCCASSNDKFDSVADKNGTKPCNAAGTKSTRVGPTLKKGDASDKRQARSPGPVNWLRA